MASDPRNRISVGIDGRQYVRNPVVYVDVLGLPTIAEAVQAASEMLRRGIVHAMSSSVNDKSTTSKIDKPDRQKPQPTANSRAAYNSAQIPSGGARRDPVSVYSAVTKRIRKPTQETETARQAAGDLPVLTGKQKLNGEQSKGTSKSWSSTKKAGPSILSKRSRPSATGAVGTVIDRVFQPAAKREKRTDTASDLVSAPASQENGTAAVKSSKGKGSNSTVPAMATKLQPFVKTGPKGLPPEKVSDAKNTTTAGGLPAVSNGGKMGRPVSSIQPGQPLSHGPNHSFNAKRAPIKKSAPKSVSKQPSQMSFPAQKAQTHGIPRSPGGSKLPSAWSQVTGKSFKHAGVRSSGLSSGMLLPKPGSATLFAKASITALGWTSKGSQLNGSMASQQHIVKKTRPQLLSDRTGISTSAFGEGVIPLPSLSDLQVKFIPGSEIIRGVRPNGYTVSREGVVKPVVSFSPKPKLPHKLRQTSVEKLFEGYRDNKKLAEGDALMRALLAEQEMYADAAGRVEYRAAVTVRLKDIRK